jgi:hypothetical protein
MSKRKARLIRALRDWWRGYSDEDLRQIGMGLIPSTTSVQAIALRRALRSPPFCCPCEDCTTWRRARAIQKVTPQELLMTPELDLELEHAPPPKETPA